MQFLMMGKRLILCLAALCALSCSDFLRLDESVYQSTEYQFATFENTKKVCTDVYGRLLSYLADTENTMRDVATDDAVYAWETSYIKTYWDGSWSAGRAIDDKWGYYYGAIAAANYFLENCPDDFPASEYMETYKERVRQLRNYPNEVTALRALFHFELLKRYGHIVIADHSLTMEEVNSLESASYEEAARWIIAELDGVIPMLPVSYAGTLADEIGRVTRGAALALKARVQLYLASPLNNPTADKKRYAAAAATAARIIASGTYALVDEAVVNNGEAQGLIFGIRQTPSNAFEANNFPIGYEGGYSGVCPSQDLVEAFDFLDGTPFSWERDKARALDFAARDPRLAKTVLSNGSLFKGERIRSYYGGPNGLPRTGATPTSYYLRKFVREETSFAVGNTTSYQHVVPLFRYAEVYLNYAEALFEASGSKDFTGSLEGVDYTMSPLQAVNAVRARAGVAPLPATLDAASFRTRLRNERRVELAFEDHRFWDLRRWQEGAKTREVHGLLIRENEAGEVVSVERVTAQKRYWDPKMNFYPIPDSERFKNPNLVQNEGW